jgi:hypothetical protein
LQVCPLAIEWLLGELFQNGVFFVGKPICSQFLMTVCADLDIFSHRYCLVFKSTDAETIVACLKELFLDTAINRGAGTPFSALVMGESVSLNNSSQLINHILSHDVYWCHIQPWD